MSDQPVQITEQYERDVLLTALRLYEAHLQAHQDALHRFRLADDAVEALSKELRAVGELLDKLRG